MDKSAATRSAYNDRQAAANRASRHQPRAGASGARLGEVSQRTGAKFDPHDEKAAAHQRQVHNSPLVAAQRKQIEGAFGLPVQRQGGEKEDELLQEKFATAQRQGPEEEELLQGKFDPIQRQSSEEEDLLQGKFGAAQWKEEPGPQANNTGLPDNLKAGIEHLSGVSMDNVKVHYNSSQPAQLNALAYAQGADIHLGSGQERHLPHEAWHVVQQAQGRVRPTMQMNDGVGVNNDEGLEREADVMGAKALQLRRADHATSASNAQVTIAATQQRGPTEASEVPGTAAGASGTKGRLNLLSTPRFRQSIQLQQMIDASPYVATQQEHIEKTFGAVVHRQGRQAKVPRTYLAVVSSRGPSQPGVAQLYTTRKNFDNDKVYNRSLTGALICGIDYPNHDLYVQDAGRIDSINAGASEGMLSFSAGGTQTFDFGLEKRGADYSKVVPEYKEDHGDLQTKAVEEILAAFSPDSVPTYDETTVTKIVKAKETFRKLVVQWDFKFGDVNPDVRRVKSEAIGVYRSLNEYLDGDLDQKTVLDLLRLYKGVVLGTVLPSVFDETSLMLGTIEGVVDELITEVGKVFSSDVGKQLRAYLQEQSDFSKTGEIMLPRGCDLVAGTVLGRASRETDENVSVINYNLNKLNNPAHHYATRILSDANDFATIEGFAKKDYFFFDNTWEFLMHGNRTSFETAFKDYTDTRYSFFESMEGLDLRGGSQAREGAGTGNVDSNAKGRFGLLLGQ